MEIVHQCVREKFWSHVDKRGTSDCWEWKSYKAGRFGYGSMRVRDERTGKTVARAAHRVSWEIHNNRLIPSGMKILHSCDNPGCVNPSHLSLGTQKDNVRDMISKGRSPHFKVTKDTVLEIRKLRNEQGLLVREVAEKLNVSETIVQDVANWHTWKNVGGHPRPKKRGQPMLKLTDRDVANIRTMHDQGWKGAELADKYGVSRSLISVIVNRKRRVQHGV